MNIEAVPGQTKIIKKIRSKKCEVLGFSFDDIMINGDFLVRKVRRSCGTKVEKTATNIQINKSSKAMLRNMKEELYTMEPLKIPRPQFDGMKFVHLNENYGFYMTIKNDNFKPMDNNNNDNNQLYSKTVFSRENNSSYNFRQEQRK
ncbi:hypothetical protein T03_15821 [Trichinella britovi]|uniref:Uncharacterized protein n=1 Tax=Trichinella britovi TaxID=45882 RepID=A0A0V1D6G6_TRIBR|nr:hypothetical protein T03_15821 [Trichinella britovi]